MSFTASLHRDGQIARHVTVDRFQTRNIEARRQCFISGGAGGRRYVKGVDGRCEEGLTHPEKFDYSQWECYILVHFHTLWNSA